VQIPFDNRYARLPDRFFARVSPTKVRDPRVIKVNRALAETLGLDADALASPEGAEVLSGNAIPEGAEPIALAYAGHQFGSFVPQLGDGRAILLGELVGKDGRRRDVQLKGAGRTPFSRGGDGRAALGPVLREYIVSEAMAALGVRTTRTLAAVTTGERVARERLLPGAVLTRVAESHIRVGTFEFFAARGDTEALALLVDHALARHYPDAPTDAVAAATSTGTDDASEPKGPAHRLLERVIDAQAKLVASWLGVGFVHGVMNTDNTTISGETIDYGPCAFLDEYDPYKKFSSIDHGGRYAFANQPRIAQWNLARLAECLLPLLAEKEEDAVRLATDALNRFPARFEAAYVEVVRAKLGLSVPRAADATPPREGAAATGPSGPAGTADATDADKRDLELVADLFQKLAANAVDYTLFFRRLCDAAERPEADASVAALFRDSTDYDAWASRWRTRAAREERSPAERARAMRRANPAFIPRNHRVEEAIEAAVERGDLGPFETLVRVLERPYDEQPDAAHLAEPPAEHERVLQTFCGT
jgi:uncharacterized protein YdiU (UPF0061 family)